MLGHHTRQGEDSPGASFFGVCGKDRMNIIKDLQSSLFESQYLEKSQQFTAVKSLRIGKLENVDLRIQNLKNFFFVILLCW